MKSDCIAVTKIVRCFWTNNVGNEEIHLRIKNLLSWQNILNNRQIAADIEEKSANQGGVLRGGISRTAFTFSYQTKGNPATEP